MTDISQVNKNLGVSSRANLWCWITVALIIIGAEVIRGRLASMPLERDEGEYAYIAQQMLKGVPPYESAYSMKFPGIYSIYALFLACFGQTITAIRLGLILFNAATILVIFLLARRVFGEIAGVAAGGVYGTISLVRPVLGLSANAEHFVVLPALLGIMLIVKSSERRKPLTVFFAAFLLGLAFIIKQHSIFFMVFGALYLLYLDLLHKPVKWKAIVAAQVVFIAGAILPFAFCCFLYWRAGLFDKFWFWTFTYAARYAAYTPLNEVSKNLLETLGPLIHSAVLIWIFVLLGIIRLLTDKRIRHNAPFVIGFFICSLLCVCPGFYFRKHYFILLLPAASLLAGVGFSVFCDWVAGAAPGTRHSIVAALAGIIVVSILLYGQRAFLFGSDVNKISRLIYGLNPFPESFEIAEYIKQNSSPDDTVAVIGSEPQIFFYSDRRSATRYIYVYPLMELHNRAEEMQKEMISEIESAKPKFIVVVSISTSWLPGVGSKMDIVMWCNQYVEKFYDIVGTIEIPSTGTTVYNWGNLPAGYTPKTKYWISVYRRK